MTQPKLRVNNKPARLSSKGGNVWVKTIYICPENSMKRAKTFASVYGNTAEEATANAVRFVKLHNVTSNIEAPAYFVEQAKSSFMMLHAFASTRSDIDFSQPIIPQLIKIIQANGN